MTTAGPVPVLLIDDEEPIRVLVQMVLNNAGFEAIPFADGQDALALFFANPDRFPLVITDMLMPGLSGPAMAKELLKLKPEIKIIFISGLSDSLPADLQGPNTRLLYKPFYPQRLMELVRELLGTE